MVSRITIRDWDGDILFETRGAMCHHSFVVEIEGDVTVVDSREEVTDDA